MWFCEGDLVEDVHGIIFDVKGLIHPPDRVVAFPRFIPDVKGDRKRGFVAYRKVYALSVRYRFLEQKFPQYLVEDPVFDERLCEVPLANIRHYYKPAERLQELRNSPKLDTLEQKALELVALLKETANIPSNNIGISGSILARLHTPKSDIDPIIYGIKNCHKLHTALTTLVEDKRSPLKPYRTPAALRKLFEFRHEDTRVGFEDFVRTEKRKVLQGTYKHHNYFIRCVKAQNEIGERYGDVHYTNAGYARIKATITDDSEAILTPCTYKTKQTRTLEGTRISKPIREIVSFRGRFNEHARKGETVVAQGKIEHAQDKHGEEWLRLLLGNKPSDFMVLA